MDESEFALINGDLLKRFKKLQETMVANGKCEANVDLKDFILMELNTYLEEREGEEDFEIDGGVPPAKEERKWCIVNLDEEEEIEKINELFEEMMKNN